MVHKVSGMAKKLTERKREDIIQAAKDEFSDKGFGATSMDRIAETAGVSKRTIYNHFDNKEELFKAITEDQCDIFMRMSEYPYQAGKPLRPQLETIATQQMNMLCTDRFLRLAKMLTSETLTSPKLTESTFKNLQKENIGVVKWIRAAVEDGKLRVKDHVAAGKQFMGLLEIFTVWPYLYGMEHVQEHEQEKRQAVIDSTVDMFLDHYEVRS
jgi:TetR/AcrR family transcriptional regulator of autoinduction and epiphytic fitness